MKVKIAFPKNLYFADMRKYIILLLTLGMIWSCKKQKQNEQASVQEPEAFSIQNFPKEVEIVPEALPTLNSWPEYMAMENSFTVLKRATNTEDVKLAIDDLIEKERELAKAKYPDDFDKLQIKSRQQVFRTFLFKVQGNLLDNRDVTEGMEQMILAYSALRQQFNILSSNTLDVKLILNDE